ncbi:MAG: MFS transporter, partial [Acidimicrobiia bacterium]|nr:MFS transporter [Acidimicrobiia bacterium]
MATSETLMAGERAPVAAEAPPDGQRPARPRGYYFEILLVSFAALLLEISYTRVVSYKLFYYYTYLVLGLALMGIGSGGVLVAVSGRLRRHSTQAVLMWSALLGAAAVAVGYVVVAGISLNTFAIWRYGTLGSFKAIALLVLLCLALFAPFFAVGVVISTLFARETERIGRLYFADLIGAGLACAVVVALLSTIGPLSTIFLAGLVMALVGVRLALVGRSRAVPVALAVTAACLLGTFAPGLLPDQRLENTKEEGNDGNFLYSEWSPIFRVEVGDLGDFRILYHDGLHGSGIYQWDGEESSLSRFQFERDVRSMPFSVLGDGADGVAIVGAAGGHEVLASLNYDAKGIDAIELNPVTHSLVTDRYADFAGNLADHPEVDYRLGDGRSFLARSDEEYDLVWYPAPDSYAAANASTAGAFVLSESYLYTSDAIQESLERLRDGGIVATQFGEVDFDRKPNRTARYVATARDALDELGIDDDPGRHILVASSPSNVGGSSLSTILVKREPFTPEEVARFTGNAEAVEGSTVRWAEGADFIPGPVSEIASRSDAELDDFLADSRYDVSAITDDRPFFWHFRPFGDILRTVGDPLDEADREDTVGERVLLLLLAVAVVLAAVFLLLPFVAIRRTWVRLPRKGLSAIYFAALGLGFIFFEITLIQRLILFLGYPTYSLTVTLMSILIFLGVGSLLSSRLAARRAQAVPVLLGSLVALTAFYYFGLTPLTEALLGLPLAARVPIAFVVLAPLGICLGMFMPLGLGALTALTEDSSVYVAWGWAVNGFASVIGSVLTTVLAMTFGFQVVLLLALGVYLIAL